MENILDRIVAQVRLKNQEIRSAYDFLYSAYDDGKPLRDLNKFGVPIVPSILSRAIDGKDFFLIAECKKASPSKGLIREPFDPVEIASSYQTGGAGGISVLVEEDFFQGCEEYLSRVKGRVNLPVLWKDFVIDSLQVLRAYYAGADMVLLIIRVLESEQYRNLIELIIKLGMTPLVEVFNPKELEQAIDLPQSSLDRIVMGVNNRDLTTFKVDLDQSVRVKDYLTQKKQSIPLISESGISSHKEVEFLKEQGFSGILVGESLLRKEDLASATKELLTGIPSR